MSAEEKLVSLFRRVRRLQALAALGEILEDIFTDSLSFTEYFSYIIRVPTLSILEEILFQTYLSINVVGRITIELLNISPLLRWSIGPYTDSLDISGTLHTVLFFTESISAPEILSHLNVYINKSISHSLRYIIEVLLTETVSTLVELYAAIFTAESVQITDTISTYLILLKSITSEIGYAILITYSELVDVDSGILPSIYQTESLSIQEGFDSLYASVNKSVSVITDMTWFVRSEVLLPEVIALSTLIFAVLSNLIEDLDLSDSVYSINTASIKSIEMIDQLLSYMRLVLSDSLDIVPGNLVGLLIGEGLSVSDTVDNCYTALSVSVASIDQLLMYMSTSLSDTLSIVSGMITGVTVSDSMSVVDTSRNVYPAHRLGGYMPPLDCRLWLTFDEGTGIDVYDVTDYQNDGQLVGGAGFTDGIRGSAYAGGGSTERCKIDHSTSLDFTDTVSCCGWIYQDGNATSTYQRITDKGGAITCWLEDESSSPSGAFAVRLTASKGSSYQQVRFYTGLSLDIPYFFAWTYDKDDSTKRLRLWIDGEEFNGSTEPSDGYNYYYGSMSTNTDDLYVGNQETGDRGWYGWIDELMFFNDPFTDDIVTSLYRNGPPLRFRVRLLTTLANIIADTLSVSGKIISGITSSDSLSITDSMENIRTRFTKSVSVGVLLMFSLVHILQESIGVAIALNTGVSAYGLGLYVDTTFSEGGAYIKRSVSAPCTTDGEWHADDWSDSDHTDWTDYLDSYVDNPHADHSDGHNDWTDHYEDHQDDLHNDWSNYNDHINHDDMVWSDAHLNWTDHANHQDDTHGDWDDYTDHSDWSDTHIDHNDHDDVSHDDWNDHSNWTDHGDHQDDTHTDWDDYTDHVDTYDDHDDHDDHDDTYDDHDDHNDHDDSHSNWTDHTDHQDDTHQDWSDYSDHQNHWDGPDYGDHTDNTYTDWDDYEHNDHSDGHNDWTDEHQDHDDHDDHSDHQDHDDYDDHGDHQDDIYTDWNDYDHNDWSNGHSDHNDYDDDPYDDHDDHGDHTDHSDHQDDGYSDWNDYDHNDWSNGHDDWTDHYEDHTDNLHNDWSDYTDHINHDDSLWTDSAHANWSDHNDWTDTVHTDWTNQPHADDPPHSDHWNWEDHLDDISPTGGVSPWGRKQANTSNATVNHCRAMGGQSPDRPGMKLKAIAIYVNNTIGDIRVAVYQGGSLSGGPEGASLRWDAGTIGEGQTGWVIKYCSSDVSLSADTPTWIAWKANDNTREVRFSASSSDAGDFQTARGRWDSTSMSIDETTTYPSTWPTDTLGSFADAWYSCYLIYRW